MRPLLICCLIASASWVACGCGGTPAPNDSKPIVGPTTDPAGEAFSKPSKPAAAAK